MEGIQWNAAWGRSPMYRLVEEFTLEQHNTLIETLRVVDRKLVMEPCRSLDVNFTYSRRNISFTLVLRLLTTLRRDAPHSPI